MAVLADGYKYRLATLLIASLIIGSVMEKELLGLRTDGCSAEAVLSASSARLILSDTAILISLLVSTNK